MPTIEVKVSISIDGRFVPGFDPYVRRLEVDEAMVNQFDTVNSATFVDVPGGTSILGAASVFAATSLDGAVSFKARGDDALGEGFPIKAGGCLVVVDADIPAAGQSPSSPIEVLDNAAVVNCKTVLGGT